MVLGGLNKSFFNFVKFYFFANTGMCILSRVLRLEFSVTLYPNRFYLRMINLSNVNAYGTNISI